MSLSDGIALDGSGNIYVANDNGTNTVTVYAAASNGNVAPIRSIMGTSTQLNGPGVSRSTSGVLDKETEAGIA